MTRLPEEQEIIKMVENMVAHINDPLVHPGSAWKTKKKLVLFKLFLEDAIAQTETFSDEADWEEEFKIRTAMNRLK